MGTISSPVVSPVEIWVGCCVGAGQPVVFAVDCCMSLFVDEVGSESVPRGCVSCTTYWVLMCAATRGVPAKESRTFSGIECHSWPSTNTT